MENFSLENDHMMNARQPFCWWMTFTKVSNPFLPSHAKWLTWPLDVCGGLGYGWFYWFSLRIFSPASLELEIFSPRYNGVSFFQHYTSWATFFSVQDVFTQEYICMLFSSRNQPAGHFFFFKSPITPSKVKWSAPKIHQTFGQLTDSDLSIISKGFWNNRRLNSQGRGEEFVSTYPYLESPYGRTDGRKYGDVITKFSRMDSLPNIITHGAPLRVLPARRLRYKI